MEANNAMQALCRSAATSYRGSLTPEALLAFMTTGVVDAAAGVLLRYAIEELPAQLWAKALAGYDSNLRATMKQRIEQYAVTHRLHLTSEMLTWLRDAP
ncbi:hypothetical protein [Burkholderia vietnamiensis]|uniref:hypothetical protein n=2 Tax=Burkholderia TaxID=32008 RepID=UPI0015947BDB|nr:hypothetical protein [Burkholderia vietnamiensis]